MDLTSKEEKPHRGAGKELTSKEEKPHKGAGKELIALLSKELIALFE